MGKGSMRRPEGVNEYADNWDRIFGNTEAATPRSAVTTSSSHMSNDTTRGGAKPTQAVDDGIESEEDRFERHMAPIRKLQAQNESNKAPTAHFPPFGNTEHYEH